MTNKSIKVKIFTSNMGVSTYGKAEKKWFLSFIEEENTRHVDPLMGWTSVDSTDSEVKLRFNSKDLAIEYAKKKGYEYIIEEEVVKKIKKKSYAENFTS